MGLYLAAFLLGVVAGLRTMTAPAAVSWAAWFGALKLSGSPLAFLGAAITPWLLTAAAAGELIADKLPRMPSRKVPLQFGARIVSGGLSGAAVGASAGGLMVGAGLGLLGAIVGTYGGAAARARLAKALGRDPPAALLEDLVAGGGAAIVVGYLL